MDEDYGYDEGSDIDNWEAEQVFQDREHEDFGDDAEDDFRDAYEAVLGVRPVFSVAGFSVVELQARTENLLANAGRF
jgi:hypothetical protein